MRHFHHTNASLRTTDQLQPSIGSVAWCNVMNPLENRNCRGKQRPVVLVERCGGHWLVMGLTTRPTHIDGHPRTSVPNHWAVGLRRPGFLWGGRLTAVSAMDIHSVVGTCDAALAEAVIGLAGLDDRVARELRASAAAHSKTHQ